MTHLMTVLVLQVAVLTLAAQGMGFFFEKKLRQPRVLGELAAGMIVGPYALGRIHIAFLHQPLFPVFPGETMHVTPELYAVAVLASIILLFLSGLETDLPTFLRFSGVGSAVGLSGVVVSFLFGNLITVLLVPSVTSMMDPAALFLGTLSTATSVGITARILSERRRMSSPEGVTILAAAVLDDVIGIVLIAIVVAIGRLGGGGIDWGRIGVVAAKAFGFWIVATAAGIAFAPRLVRGLKRLHSVDVIVGTSFGLALLLAGLAETVGLAMIIGAYVTGLALSHTDVADEIRERMHGLYHYLVPLFFAVMGMMVDFAAVARVFVFGLIFSAVAIAGKLVGCGLPALAFGFNRRGALRIGAGMLPRGEVTLIVAGIGLSAGIIGPELFGVSVMTLLVGSIVAPPALIAAFRGGSGYRNADDKADAAQSTEVHLDLPTVSAADFIRARIIEAFRSEEFFVNRVDINSPIYRIRQDEKSITLVQRGSDISLVTAPENEQLVRLILVEEIVELKELFEGLQRLGDPGELGGSLLDGLLGDDE